MERDSETSHGQTRFPTYASNLGRWMTPDPLGGEVSNPQLLNRYAYVTDNPTSYIDPLGLDANGSTGCAPNSSGGVTCSGATTVTVNGGTPTPINACTDPAAFEASYSDGAPCTNYNPNPGVVITIGTGGGGPQPVASHPAGPLPGSLRPVAAHQPAGSQPQAQCNSQYDQAVSRARSALTRNAVIVLAAAGVPGDVALAACGIAGELAPVCMEAVEAALAGPTGVGIVSLVRQYESAVNAAKARLQACEEP